MVSCTPLNPDCTAHPAAIAQSLGHRKPTAGVFIHSDHGSQYTSKEWQRFLKDHNLICSMSRRGNCHDNAVAESFFGLLKRERVKRKSYKTREDAHRDIFDYIELFVNPKRRHSYNGNLSPVDYEKQYFMKLGGVYGSGGDSGLNMEHTSISTNRRTTRNSMARAAQARERPTRATGGCATHGSHG